MRAPPHVMPALVTPFDTDGEIDLEAHRHNVTTLRSRGVEGFLLGGSTGEGPYLEPGERAALVKTTRDELGGDVFVMCGVAAETVRVAARQVGEAESNGADAALVLTPTTLVRGDRDAVHTFYQQLSRSADLPLLMYSMPRVAGYELPVELAAELLAGPGIVGMKDSGGHPVRLQQLATGAGDGTYLFTGSSPAVSLSVAGGAHGAITASGNYAYKLVRDVAAAARKSADRAADGQERLTGLTKLVEARGLPGTKVAATVAGLRPGASRAPLLPLPDDEAERLRRSLAALRHQLLG